MPPRRPRHHVLPIFLVFMAVVTIPRVRGSGINLGTDVESVKAELLSQCKQIREGKRDMCDFILTGDAFGRFLDVISSQVGKQTRMEWKIRCKTGILVSDPPVCWAFAYLTLPFPLHSKDIPSNLQNSYCSHSNPEDRYQTKRAKKVDISKYDLVPLTVENRDLREKTCSLLRTSCGLGLEPEVLGQEMRNTKLNMRRMKLNLVVQRLEKIPSSKRNRTVVLFTDSSDVFYQRRKEYILTTFFEHDADIVVSGEMDCFPFRYFPMSMTLGRNTLMAWGDVSRRYKNFHVCNELFPNAEGPSTARWILRALKTVTNSVPDWFLNRWPGSDQGLYTMIYLSRRFNVKIDTCRSLFSSISSVEEYEENMDISPSNLYSRGPHRNLYNLLKAVKTIDANISNSPFEWVWANKFTDRVPAVLHFNGGQVAGIYNNARDTNLMTKAEVDFHTFLCRTWKRLEISLLQNITLLSNTSCMAVKIGCVEKYREAQSWGCALDEEIMGLMANKSTSGLGFFLEWSPVRFFTPLNWTEHVAFARAVFDHTLGSRRDEFSETFKKIQEFSGEHIQLNDIILHTQHHLQQHVVVPSLSSVFLSCGFLPAAMIMVWKTWRRFNGLTGVTSWKIASLSV
ncbi:hypothetical protein AAMO2058_001358500 [Amorphochlora amoebiformis]